MADLMTAGIDVFGGGPAGSSAAISAALHGAPVRIFEQSRLPKHKVCGEFLSPEIVPLLEKLGVWPAFAALAPSRIGSVRLQFGGRSKRWSLAEPAYGLSRYRFDNLLLEHARSLGTEIIHKRADSGGRPVVILAHGRRFQGKKPRFFGFKAHYFGPQNDILELVFTADAYVGICSIEDGRTNVCGIASEHYLASAGFDVDELLWAIPAVRERLTPVSRGMDWKITGPLLFGKRFTAPLEEGVYPAGDALGFVDPFTGTGILSAVWSGSLAGKCAARKTPVFEYMASCRTGLKRQYRTSAALRTLAGWRAAAWLAPFIPGALLYRLTRPRVAA
jgi:menaquinone-9 beta-reductase